MLAASTVALTSSSSGVQDFSFYPAPSKQGAKSVAGGNCAASDKEKFAPRFDGLRFIETLVTAHR